MLLTIPVLFAFYSLLSTAIELRGAPFFGWIHDLSRHDPYYVTAVLMGVTQFWQQRMTPATGMDPAQQKMMMFMPVIFTVMFLWLPAGVAHLLARHQRLGHRAAVPDELPDRSAECPDRPAAGGAAGEARRRRQDRRRCASSDQS